MVCTICNQDRDFAGSLVEIEPDLESIGMICQSCVVRLKERRPTAEGCGYGSKEDPCANAAEYGLRTSEQSRSPDSPIPEGSLPTAAEPLLCEKHAMKLQGDTLPPWEENE
ncbi:hypothetical protein ACERIT_05010 [Halopenitus sp. H-Gu1]|uniref:hypothetical protein n=1 Tax=Halopenitus sp. H-Gu1 TaxID=3242697 RepID=UPI00359EA1B4